MAITVRDIAWLAGLLEGEGWFTIQGGSPTIGLNMTDEDIVARAARLVGATNMGIKPNSPNGNNIKTQYKWTIGGTKAVQWGLTIYSFMGQRRRARIRELMAVWRHSRAYRRLVVCGHEGRKHFGKGMCRQCYGRHYHGLNRESVNAKNNANYYKHHAARRAQQTAYRIRKQMEKAS